MEFYKVMEMENCLPLPFIHIMYIQKLLSPFLKYSLVEMQVN